MCCYLQVNNMTADVFAFFIFYFFLLHCSWISRRPAGRASWGLLLEGFLLLGDYVTFGRGSINRSDGG